MFFLVLRTLASLLDIQAGGSRMEVASGKDGAAFFTLDYTKNRAELACKIASLPLCKKTKISNRKIIFKKI